MLYEGKILKVNSDQNKQNIIFLIIKRMKKNHRFNPNNSKRINLIDEHSLFQLLQIEFYLCFSMKIILPPDVLSFFNFPHIT